MLPKLEIVLEVLLNYRCVSHSKKSVVFGNKLPEFSVIVFYDIALNNALFMNGKLCFCFGFFVFVLFW